MKAPLISVILPVYNAQATLYTAIESILSQTYANFELLIINDASSDKSLQILRSFKDKRIKILTSLRKEGVSASLNKGLTIAKGKYIARMDSDDISHPDRFRKQVQYLENNKNVGAIGSWVVMINSVGKSVGTKRYSVAKNKGKQRFFLANQFCHPSMMFRADLIKKYGFYDPNLNGAEDYDLWLRFNKHTRLDNIPEYLLWYRLHKNSVSFLRHNEIQTSLIKTYIKAALQYGYPKYLLFLSIRPIISLLLPLQFKKFIYRNFYKYK